MAISLVAVGQKITAGLMNLLIGSANAQGQSLVAPSSVAGAGSSVTALGVVNLSGCSAVTINGVFTSKYTNYRILMNLANNATGHGIFAQLAAAGSPNTTNNYDEQTLVGSVSAASAAQSLAGNSWPLAPVTTNIAAHTITIDLFGPNLASACAGMVTDFGTSNPMTTAAIANIGISNRLSTAFDGITIIGTGMTGQISIYGFNAGV